MRGRGKAWTDFVAWCRTRRLRPLPAHPWTVAAYARWCEARYRTPAIAKRIREIARAHVLACHPAPERHPVVSRTLRRIERRQETAGLRAALFPGDVVASPDAPPPTEPPPAEPPRRPRRGLRATPPLVSRR